jgi:hypothetical protein
VFGVGQDVAIYGDRSGRGVVDDLAVLAVHPDRACRPEFREAFVAVFQLLDQRDESGAVRIAARRAA